MPISAGRGVMQDGYARMIDGRAVMYRADGSCVECCEGREIEYVRAVDCCNRLGFVFWVPVLSCCRSTRTRAWEPGRRTVIRITIAGRADPYCAVIAPDAPVRTRDGIVRDYPNEVGGIVVPDDAGPGCPDGTVECIGGCNDPTCPECVPCCTYSATEPDRCGHAENCIECGASWVFEIVVRGKWTRRESEMRIITGTFHPPGYRDPDCIGDDGFGNPVYVWYWGHALLPVNDIEDELRIRAVRTCDDYGSVGWTCDYRYTRTTKWWDRAVYGIGESEGVTPPVYGPGSLRVYEMHEATDTLNDCDSNDAWLWLGQTRGGSTLSPSPVCMLQPHRALSASNVPLAGAAPGYFAPACAGGYSEVVPNAWPGVPSCAAARLPASFDVFSDWAGQSSQDGGTAFYRGRRSGGHQISQFEETTDITATWTMTPLALCPQGVSPCGGGSGGDIPLLRLLRGLT